MLFNSFHKNVSQKYFLFIAIHEIEFHRVFL
nr:MAG TPA: hypothetical protein [Caudoviricetes sp.]